MISFSVILLSITVLTWTLVASVEDCFVLKDQCQLNCPSFGLLNFGPILSDYFLSLRNEAGLNLNPYFSCYKFDQYEWTLDNSQENKGFEGVAKDCEGPTVILKCSPSFSITVDTHTIVLESTHVCSSSDGYDDQPASSIEQGCLQQQSLQWTELGHKAIDLALVGSTLYSLSAQTVSVFNFDGGHAMLSHYLQLPNNNDFNVDFSLFTSIAADNEKVVIVNKHAVCAYYFSHASWSILIVFPSTLNPSGSKLALSGSTLMISHPAVNKVHLYTHVESPTSGEDDLYSLAQTLTGPEDSLFGSNIAIDGDTALIVAPHTNEVWCYQRQADQWKPVASIVPRPSLTFAITSVAMSNGVAVIAGSHEVHVYQMRDAQWELQRAFEGETIDSTVLSEDTLLLFKLNAVTGVSLSKILSTSATPLTLRNYGRTGEGFPETRYLLQLEFLFCFVLFSSCLVCRCPFMVKVKCVKADPINDDDRDSV